LSSWKRGRDLLLDKLQQEAKPMQEFLQEMEANPPPRVSGTAVFMTGSRDGVPPALLNNLEHNKIVHETVVVITVLTENVPRVAADKRREVSSLGQGFFRVRLHYGFMERPNIPRVLKSSSREFDIDLADTTFFLSRETLVASPAPKMALWRLRLFIAMSRNMSSAATYFGIPSERVVELGTQVPL